MTLKSRLTRPMPAKESPMSPEPFLRWAGGKTQLIKQYAPFFPEPSSYTRYLEPFLGGGAIYFHLQSKHKKKALIADFNPDLINTYKAIARTPKQLMKYLEQHKEKHSKEYYYDIRKRYNYEKFGSTERASIFIYLNKSSFNGLHRVNRVGHFNVPFGHAKSPGVYNEANILAISTLLKDAMIESSSYEKVLMQAKKGDFMFLDPPYYYLEGEKNFTTYVKDAFLEKQHVELANHVKNLHAKGCKFMLSNSDSAFIRNLYSDKDFKITTIHARRFINCLGDKRGVVKEVLVTNY